MKSKKTIENSKRRAAGMARTTWNRKTTFADKRKEKDRKACRNKKDLE